jgi:hypothetical protein
MITMMMMMTGMGKSGDVFLVRENGLVGWYYFWFLSRMGAFQAMWERKFGTIM